MKIEATHIGEFNEPDFRAKGIVFEAETEKDSELIEAMLSNPKRTLMYLKSFK